MYLETRALVSRIWSALPHRIESSENLDIFTNTLKLGEKHWNVKNYQCYVKVCLRCFARMCFKLLVIFLAKLFLKILRRKQVFCLIIKFNAKKMKFYIKDFLLKKSLTENFILCPVIIAREVVTFTGNIVKKSIKFSILLT